MENPEPRAQYLNVVLRQIDRTYLRIPRFQRHFVWEHRQIIDLMESIRKGYPIGSVLTWKVGSDEDYFSGFRTGPFPPPKDAQGAFEVVLDGAQRLSTLYGVLRNPRAGLEYQVLYNLRDLEFAHYAMAAGDETGADAAISPWLVPMSALFDSRRFLQVQSRISGLADAEDLLPRALDLFSTFQDYQIPIIALSDAILEDVVEVFRRVNSSGTPLSSVDFVRALTWQSRFDLEETFDGISSEFTGKPLEGISDEILIRCLAIAAGLSQDARDIVNLKKLSTRPEGLTHEVASMTLALAKMSQFLEHIEVRKLEEIPYETQRLILFALMFHNADVPSTEIESWLWRSTFAEEHQSKPESYLTRLVREIREGRVQSALEVRKPIDPLLLATRVRRVGSSVTTGFDLLARRMRPRSLISGELILNDAAVLTPLYSRDDLQDEEGQVSPMVLANLVLLNAEDAAQVRTHMTNGDASQLFDQCQQITGDAASVWASQGLEDPTGLSAREVLRARSIALLGNFIS